MCLLKLKKLLFIIGSVDNIDYNLSLRIVKDLFYGIAIFFIEYFIIDFDGIDRNRVLINVDLFKRKIVLNL